VNEDEVIKLLREIRDLLAASDVKCERYNERNHQLYEEQSRLYEEQLREAKPNWSKIFLSYVCLFLVLACGVFVGVLVGLGVSRP
jgi:hypothetical protein